MTSKYGRSSLRIVNNHVYMDREYYEAGSLKKSSVNYNFVSTSYRNRWHHVVMTSNGTIYHNGTKKVSGKYKYDFHQGTEQALALGGLLNTKLDSIDSIKDGMLIKEVRMFDKIITDDDARKLYKDGNK
jgi:hypothetical protein